MREWLAQPVESPVLAFLTTLHCAGALLRHYRSGKASRLTVLPSIVFAGMPWVLSSPLWLGAGAIAHVAWIAACERLLPPPPAPIAPPAAPKPPPRRKGFQPLAVLATFEETPEIRTFRLARPPDLAFRAGQFVMVRVTIDGTPLVRCYSITSAPETTGYLDIAVRCQGTVSRHLHETVRPGMQLEVNGPGGAFVYPPGSRPIVLLAGGIGITPLLGMLRHGLHSEPLRPIALVLSAKTVENVPFLDELRVLEKRHPQFRLAITLSAASTTPPFLSGRIDGSTIAQVTSDPRACVYMICGPLAMIEQMRRVVESLGVAAEQIHFEKFEAALSLASATGALTQLTCRKAGRTIPVREGQTILDAADAAGVTIPSLCRVGVCATCRTHLISGSVEGDFDAIDPSEQAAGYVLACVARPLTDCVIEV